MEHIHVQCTYILHVYVRTYRYMYVYMQHIVYIHTGIYMYVHVYIYNVYTGIYAVPRKEYTYTHVQ